MTFFEQIQDTYINRANIVTIKGLCEGANLRIYVRTVDGHDVVFAYQDKDPAANYKRYRKDLSTLTGHTIPLRKFTRKGK